MCVDLTAESESSVGEGLSLCADYESCLSTLLGFDLDQPGPSAIVFRAFEASAAVVEYDYFDMDYRSEFSAIHETTFAPRITEVVRVHFFDGEPMASSEPLWDYVRRSERNYLGYVVIRPQEPASVGRALISARRRLPCLVEPGTVTQYVRTRVAEEVNLFGVPLRATGVPFMEQDGQLLRCAHVTAWMAHYSAVLRGTVSRRTIASFSEFEHSIHTYGRAFPSAGVSDLHFSQMLRRADLPPEYVDFALLLSTRELSWTDREGLFDAVAKAPDVVGLTRIWLTENITSTVCRYLNSGVPCILNLDEGHSVLVCGYVRRRDVHEEYRPKADIGPTTVVGFIVQDDQSGPFEILMLEEMLAHVSEAMLRAEEPSNLSIIVPLPVGLWLPGEVAENVAADVFVTALKSRALSDPPGAVSNGGSDAARTRLREVADQVGGSGPGNFALRAYAANGADFKTEFANRVGDEDAARTMGYAVLPKYVWVVELIDRIRREEHEPSVVGTVVLDGSAVYLAGQPKSRQPAPLVVHIPGEISIIDGADVYADENWIQTSVDAYPSGRWGHVPSAADPETDAGKDILRGIARRAKAR